jgi:AraC-like DNA-binding protein
MHVFGVPVGQKIARKDPTVHGTPDFPMGMYDTFLDRDKLDFIQWHWHDEIQFCVVTKGVCKFYVNENSYLLKEGHGIFINSNCLHMIKPIDTPRSAYICLMLDPKLLTFFPSSIVDARYVQPILYSSNLRIVLLTNEEPWHQEIIDRLLTMRTLYEEKRYGYELDLCVDVVHIWQAMVHNLVKHDNLRFRTKVDYQKIKQIFTFLHDNYHNKFSLQHLASAVNLSAPECCRFFKRVANCTIVEYLTDYRLKRSLELLRFSDMNISQIAYEVGFSSSSYFVDRFRKNVGIPPTSYRKKLAAQKKTNLSASSLDNPIDIVPPQPLKKNAAGKRTGSGRHSAGK